MAGGGAHRPDAGDDFQALVDFVGEHARIAPDSAGTRPRPHAGETMDEMGRAIGGEQSNDGYAPGQREALDKLLDTQEKREPSTPI